MKFKPFCFFVLNLPFFISPLLADVDLDQENVGSENIQQIEKRTPFSFETHFDSVNAAKIRNHNNQEGDHITFAEAFVGAGAVVYYDDHYSEGGRIGLAYTATYIGFEENPWFNQDHFENVTLNLTAFTKRFNGWFWRTQLSINVDADEWDTPYTNYDIILWGRYTFNKNIGFHIGFWGQTGMHMNYIFPIIGADWQISNKWKLNLVVPVNVSLQYSLNKKWALALAGRTFNSRHRVHKKVSKARDLVYYLNVGAEFMVMYDSGGLTANVHAGTTLGGRYRIANKNNHHAVNYKLKPSAYFGAEADVSF